MTERVQALALLILGFIASVALWTAYAILDDAKTPEAVQAGTMLAAIASNVVTGIAGFMVGRATANVEHADRVGPVDFNEGEVPVP